jgi:hypothetical protein
MARFSKKAFIAELAESIQLYELDFGFDRNDGYSQVEGKGEEINRAYGRFDMLCDLLDEYTD